MKDKIKRYARLLSKYKWIVFYVTFLIVVTVGSQESEFGFFEGLFYDGILAGLFVGGMWLLVLWIRFIISSSKEMIDFHEYLEEETFESQYQMEVKRRRRKAEKRMKLKKKIQMLRNRL